MNITKAIYGNKDVLSIVQSHVKDEKLKIKVCNSIFGDPQPFKEKFLEITIDEKHYKIKENCTFRFPKIMADGNKLGIFYTNNHNSVAGYCLRDLLKFKNLGVQILSCTWSNIPNNPFVEIESINKVSSHLTIMLQILQMLYFAQKLDKYSYVAFLEHDVLYPENYFEFEQFDAGVVVNMNYLGLCRNGFQEKNQNDEPLHQMIMKFDFAINHFEKHVRLLLERTFSVLEPQDREQRWCSNPSLHVNNNQHFTSHHSIYSKSKIRKDNEYWGCGQALWNTINSNKY